MRLLFLILFALAACAAPLAFTITAEDSKRAAYTCPTCLKSFEPGTNHCIVKDHPELCCHFGEVEAK